MRGFVVQDSGWDSKLAEVLPLYQTQRNEATLARIHARLDDALFAEAWEQGRKPGLGEAVELALGTGEPTAGNLTSSRR